MIILPDKHITFASANDMNQLIKPLQPFNINHLVYVKRFNDGSCVNLCNRPEWTRYFYNKQLYKRGLFEGKEKNYQSSYILWNTLADQEVFKAARTDFYLEDGITIVKEGAEYCEFFYIGTNQKQPQLNNFFVNNLDLLNRFVLYFRDRGKDLIKKASKYKINHVVIDTSSIQSKELILLKQLNVLELKKQFVRDTKIKSYYLNNNQTETSFSNREIDCIKLLLEGKTALEAGKILYISSRTVEKHLDNIRLKLNCHKKSAIIEILLKNGFSFYGKSINIFS